MLSTTGFQEATGYPNNTADLSPARDMTLSYNTPRGYLLKAFYPEPN
jgi:hypothetical protein